MICARGAHHCGPRARRWVVEMGSGRSMGTSTVFLVAGGKQLCRANRDLAYTHIRLFISLRLVCSSSPEQLEPRVFQVSLRKGGISFSFPFFPLAFCQSVVYPIALLYRNADAGIDASILFRIIYFPAGSWWTSSQERNVLDIWKKGLVR